MEDTVNTISLIVQFGLPILLLVLAYFTGNMIEKGHFRKIRKREDAVHGFPVVSFDTMPDDWRADSCTLVTGSIVISLDYFKRVIAGLRGLVGGRVKTYEAIVKGEPIQDPGLPESFRVLVKELQSLGLSVEVISENDEKMTFGKEEQRERLPKLGLGLGIPGGAR